MKTLIENYNFNVKWTDVSVDTYVGKYSNMSNYHMHDYFEISVILSGNVTALTDVTSISGNSPKILLFPPKTPHFVKVFENEIYNRTNLLFSTDFISDINAEYSVLNLFKVGNLLVINKETATKFINLIKLIKNENNSFRKKLLIYYLLSIANDLLSENKVSSATPTYVINALKFVNENYNKKIVAKDLAWDLKVCRTTLLTSFKKFTGLTFYDYLTKRRLNVAMQLLKQGLTAREVAEKCGFNEPSNLTRAFKRQFNVTPTEYLKQ